MNIYMCNVCVKDHIHISTNKQTEVCKYLSIYSRYLYIYIYLYVRIFVRIYICIHIFISYIYYIYTYMLCIYIYIYTYILSIGIYLSTYLNKHKYVSTSLSIVESLLELTERTLMFLSFLRLFLDILSLSQNEPYICL
jgi:hypothetical protein